MTPPGDIDQLQAEIARLVAIIGLPLPQLPRHGAPGSADEGLFFWIDNGQFILIEADFDGHVEHIRTAQLDDFLYTIFRQASASLAFSVPTAHWKPGGEPRRGAWPVQLGLMARLSEAWRERLAQEFAQAQLRTPPRDGAGPISLAAAAAAITPGLFTPVPGRSLIGEKLALHDAVLMTVLQADDQTIVGQVERVYSRRFEGPMPYDDGPLTFIGAAGSWGSVCLQPGERALVFLAFLPHAGRVHQGHWRAHFSIEEIGGNAVAIAHWDLTAHDADHADPLRSQAFLPDPARPARVAIPWRVVEDQLLQELGTDAESARPWLVLLPGMDGSGLLFDDFIAALGSAVRPQVISYPVDRALGYAELVDLVRSRLPVNQAYYLLGESFSSPVAIALAAERPPMLMGLIISCGFASNPVPAMRWLRSLVRFAPLSHRLTGLAAPLLLGRRFRPALRQALQRALGQAPAPLLRQRLRAVLEVDHSAHVANVAVPVLYLQATHDRVVPAAAARHLRSLQARVRVVTLHGPHLLLQVAPYEAAAAIRAFIESRPAS